MINRLIKQVFEHRLLIVIILLAFVFRFIGFDQRFVFGPDQTRDILVAQEALKHGTLPLIGAFSSAGPFVFGQLIYWFIMLAYLPARQLMIAPWLALLLVDLVVVWLAYHTGKRAEDKALGYLTALFSAVSTSLVLRSLALSPHTLVTVATALTLFAGVSLLTKKKLRYVFLLGLGIGLGFNFHFQAINLFFYTLCLPFWAGKAVKKWLLGILAATFGFILPNLPFFYWDFVYTKGANISNLLDYLLLGQYRIWVPNRWLTYVFTFWPQFWGRVIGGREIIAILLGVLLIFVILWRMVNKKLHQPVVALGLIFILQFLLNRYYRGERLEGYLLYFIPLVIFFSAWTIRQVLRQNRFAGLAILTVVVFSSVLKTIQDIKGQNNHLDRIRTLARKISVDYPGKTFRVYDFYGFDANLAHPLSGVFYFSGLQGPGGVNLGVTQGLGEYNGRQPDYQVDLKRAYQVYVLKDGEEKEKGWLDYSGEFFYRDILFWWQEKPLTTTFSLSGYLEDRLLN